MSKNKKHITVFEVDIDSPPPLDEEQQTKLDALAAKPDSEMDYSDIPPVKGLESFYRPVKK